MKKLTTLTIAEAVVFFAAISVMSTILSSFVANAESQTTLWLLLLLVGMGLAFAAILWAVGRLIGWRSYDMWVIALFTTALAALIQYTGRLGTARMALDDVEFWGLYGVVVALSLVISVGYDLAGLYSGTARAGWLLVVAGTVAWGIGFLRLSGEISAWFFAFASLGIIAIVVGLWKLLRTRGSESPGERSATERASRPR